MAALPEVMTALMGLIPYLVLLRLLVVAAGNTHNQMQMENLAVLVVVFLVLMQVFKLAALVIRHLHLRHKAITAVVDTTRATSPELVVGVLVR
jgi:hypothetical protein